MTRTSETQPVVAIIGGTSFYSLPSATDASSVTIDTPYGSAEVVTAQLEGVPVAFLARHGAGHHLPPSAVNYRANIAALATFEPVAVVAVNVCGAIDPALRPGELALLTDFADFTRGRADTFFDGTSGEVVHVDMSDAYDADVRRLLAQAAGEAGVPLGESGVYACFNGPRFESPAEIRLAALAGCTLVGMTGVPEVALAREAGLRYASIAIVSNEAPGLGEPLSVPEIQAAVADARGSVVQVLERFVTVLSPLRDELGRCRSNNHSAAAVRAEIQEEA